MLGLGTFLAFGLAGNVAVSALTGVWLNTVIAVAAVLVVLVRPDWFLDDREPRT